MHLCSDHWMIIFILATLLCADHEAKRKPPQGAICTKERVTIEQGTLSYRKKEYEALPSTFSRSNNMSPNVYNEDK